MPKRLFANSLIGFVLALNTPFALAEYSYNYDLQLSDQLQPTSQYIYSTSDRTNLVPVELLGAVNKPGVYYVPEDSDLFRLRTLAGGISSHADTEQVTVRKKRPNSWSNLESSSIESRGDSYSIDIDEVIRSGGQTQLTLSANDFVYVPKDEPVISDDMFRTASVVSLVVGSILTAVLISDRTGKD